MLLFQGVPQFESIFRRNTYQLNCWRKYHTFASQSVSHCFTKFSGTGGKPRPRPIMMFNTPAWIGPCPSRTSPRDPCHHVWRLQSCSWTPEPSTKREHGHSATQTKTGCQKNGPSTLNPTTLATLIKTLCTCTQTNRGVTALMLASMSPRNFSKFFASWATATWQTSDYWQCLPCWGKGFFLAWKLTKGASFMAPGVVDESGDSLSSLEVVS